MSAGHAGAAETKGGATNVRKPKRDKVNSNTIAVGARSLFISEQMISELARNTLEDVL